MNMKYFCFLLLFFSTFSYGKRSNLLKCLGQEELYIHKQQIGGALFTLNKNLISLMLQFKAEDEIKPNLINQVCTTAYPYMSSELLKILLEEKNRIFQSHKARKKFSEDDIAKQALKIFFTYVSKLNAEKPCLLKKIPSLQSVFDNFQYFELETPAKDFVKLELDLTKVLNKLNILAVSGQC